MRTITIDEKWSFTCQDVNTETAEKYEEPFIARYGEINASAPQQFRGCNGAKNYGA